LPIGVETTVTEPKISSGKGKRPCNGIASRSRAEHDWRAPATGDAVSGLQRVVNDRQADEKTTIEGGNARSCRNLEDTFDYSGSAGTGEGRIFQRVAYPSISFQTSKRSFATASTSMSGTCSLSVLSLRPR
jgi:hypothetical protein